MENLDREHIALAVCLIAFVTYGIAMLLINTPLHEGLSKGTQIIVFFLLTVIGMLCAFAVMIL